MRYHIKTLGCQMNESDSERIANFLKDKGYKSAPNIEGADLIVVNSCSVRQSAIDRVFGLKQKFKKLKAKKILTGCVLKSDKKKFKEFFDEIKSIEEFYQTPINSSLVPIMTGCDNYCTYCVVPYTRGREKSRLTNEVINDVKKLIKEGHKEIMLLGQNVNSYKYGFAKLLKKLNDIPGDFIIKFLTNHPKDFSDELINAIANCKKIAKEIHLPIQSGDDEILRKMNRGYTVKQYKNLIKKIRQKIPGVKISTDVIVGFPSETKEQFQNTVKAFKAIKFDKAYINKYSARVGTTAARFKDDVPLEEKKRRWKILDEIANPSRFKKAEKIIVILGPTASGKSDLAVKLAKKFSAQGGGEIISADSRQVYKGMDIGTGKITKKEMRGICHHCLDIASPKTQFTVAQYKKNALDAINKIYKKNKIPVLCGGTGFYIQAVVEGLDIPRVKPDWKLRRNLEKKTTEELFKELKKLDSRRAKNIDARNRRRLIRALEIIKKTGKPIPALEKNSQFDVLYLGTKKSQKELKELIKRRLMRRFSQGMIQEVRKLKNPPAGGGISWKRLDDLGLEYRYIARYLRGQLSREEMVEQLQKEIEHYAKRQMTWFKRDKSIHWIKSYKQAERLVKEFLRK